MFIHDGAKNVQQIQFCFNTSHITESLWSAILWSRYHITISPKFLPQTTMDNNCWRNTKVNSAALFVVGGGPSCLEITIIIGIILVIIIASTVIIIMNKEKS